MINRLTEWFAPYSRTVFIPAAIGTPILGIVPGLSTIKLIITVIGIFVASGGLGYVSHKVALYSATSKARAEGYKSGHDAAKLEADAARDKAVELAKRAYDAKAEELRRQIEADRKIELSDHEAMEKYANDLEALLKSDRVCWSQQDIERAFYGRKN